MKENFNPTKEISVHKATDYNTVIFNLSQNNNFSKTLSISIKYLIKRQQASVVGWVLCEETGVN